MINRGKEGSIKEKRKGGIDEGRDEGKRKCRRKGGRNEGRDGGRETRKWRKGPCI